MKLRGQKLRFRNFLFVNSVTREFEGASPRLNTSWSENLLFVGYCMRAYDELPFSMPIAGSARFLTERTHCSKEAAFTLPKTDACP